MSAAKLFELNDALVKERKFVSFIDYIATVIRNPELNLDHKVDPDLFNDLNRYKLIKDCSVPDSILYKYDIFYNSINTKDVDKIFDVASLVLNTDYTAEPVLVSGSIKYHKYRLTGDAFERLLAANSCTQLLRYYKLLSDCTFIYYLDYETKLTKEMTPPKTDKGKEADPNTASSSS